MQLGTERLRVDLTGVPVDKGQKTGQMREVRSSEARKLPMVTQRP